MPGLGWPRTLKVSAAASSTVRTSAASCSISPSGTVSSSSALRRSRMRGLASSTGAFRGHHPMVSPPAWCGHEPVYFFGGGVLVAGFAVSPVVSILHWPSKNTPRSMTMEAVVSVPRTFAGAFSSMALMALALPL
jgi:hypothetical protein